MECSGDCGLLGSRWKALAGGADRADCADPLGYRRAF